MLKSPQYPKILLPNKNKCYFCCSIDDHSLIRYSPPGVDLKDSVSGHLTDRAIGKPSSTHMPDLSTSLFSIYDTEHTKIEILKMGLTSYCEPNHESELPIYKQDFLIDMNRGYWFVRINEITGKRIECTHNKQTIEAICKIEHTPTKCNFWHFSVRWYITNFSKNWHELDTRGNNWWEKLAHSARIFFKGFGTTDEPEKIAISKSCHETSS
ncbi:MAG: hypothetical protein IPG12_10905 [Saprospiraceae bacterium]|nr:hypothetical protein [Saprospiraceae bacterium]